MTEVPDLSPQSHLPPAAPPRRPAPLAVWIVGALVALAVVVGALVWRLDAGRKAAPSAQGPAPAAAPASAAALQARIDELEQQLAEARRAARAPAVSSALDAATVQALGQRLERLEAAQRRSGRAAAAAIAADLLAAAAQSSRPFPGELAFLERITGEDALVAGLKPLAETGAPTRASLAAEFPAVAARAAAAAHAPAGEQSFLGRAVAVLGSLINVRRVDDLTGAGVDAILARAERQAGDGDLEGALDQMRGLPKPALAVTADWREKARRRIEIERRIAALRAAALRDLASNEAISPGLVTLSPPPPALSGLDAGPAPGAVP